jgi:hypothetical protein
MNFSTNFSRMSDHHHHHHHHHYFSRFAKKSITHSTVVVVDIRRTYKQNIAQQSAAFNQPNSIEIHSFSLILYFILVYFPSSSSSTITYIVVFMPADIQESSCISIQLHKMFTHSTLTTTHRLYIHHHIIDWMVGSRGKRDREKIWNEKVFHFFPLYLRDSRFFSFFEHKIKYNRI